MPTSMMIVDDFLQDAEGFRKAALGLTYPDLQGNFPGRNSLQRLQLTGLTEEVSRLTGERLRPIEPLRSHAKCRITLAGDIGRGRVHVDPGYWSGILYLSRDEDCAGGTDFFRHIPTNTDQAPTTPEALRKAGFETSEQMQIAILQRDTLDESKWERTMTVPMRFNRLVLLRPWLWHTAGPGFGDTIENGRLIFVMFFNRVG